MSLVSSLVLVLLVSSTVSTKLSLFLITFPSSGDLAVTHHQHQAGVPSPSG
jgi:hypothetical protein